MKRRPVQPAAGIGWVALATKRPPCAARDGAQGDRLQDASTAGHDVAWQATAPHESGRERGGRYQDPTFDRPEHSGERCAGRLPGARIARRLRVEVHVQAESSRPARAIRSRKPLEPGQRQLLWGGTCSGHQFAAVSSRLSGPQPSQSSRVSPSQCRRHTQPLRATSSRRGWLDLLEKRHRQPRGGSRWHGRDVLLQDREHRGDRRELRGRPGGVRCG